MDVILEGACLRGIANSILLDAGNAPVPVEITLRDVRSLATPGIVPALTFTGTDAVHRLHVTLDNVVVDGIRAKEITTRYADFSKLRAGNLRPVGKDVHVVGSERAGTPYPCANTFPPFPENRKAPASLEIVPVIDTNFR